VDSGLFTRRREKGKKGGVPIAVEHRGWGIETSNNSCRRAKTVKKKCTWGNKDRVPKGQQRTRTANVDPTHCGLKKREQPRIGQEP